ncbi:MAG: AEC family transporter [Rhodospirillales bacterium]|nr:AEC family transporter [Rhodospirillales bacterium]
MINDIFAVIAPVFISAGLGFIWARAGQDFPVQTISSLTMLIGTPCLIFHTLVNIDLDLRQVVIMAGGALMALSIFAALGLIVLKLTGLSLRGYLPCLMFPNTGNMGLPLGFFAFGAEGLALALSFFVVNSIGQFTVGDSIAAGSVSVRRLVRTPVLYAVAAGLFFMVSGVKSPVWLNNTTQLLGGMAIPLMLIALGNSLARLKLTGAGRVLGLAVFRLGMGFAVGWGLAEILGLEGAARGVLIMQSSMPAAVFNYMFAQHYATEPDDVAGMVILSTAIGFAGLPFLLWFVL